MRLWGSVIEIYSRGWATSDKIAAFTVEEVLVYLVWRRGITDLHAYDLRFRYIELI